MSGTGESTIVGNNPLEKLTYSQAMTKAANFWKFKLDHIVEEDDFVKGVIVFQDLHTARDFIRNPSSGTGHLTQGRNVLSELSKQQKMSVRRFLCKAGSRDRSGNDSERGEDRTLLPKSSWDHIKTLSTGQWQIMATCCLAAMTQGWDQSSMNGANVSWPVDLGVDITNSSGALIFGAVNAMPFFAGAVVGSLITDPVIDIGIGRRGAIALGGLASLFPVLCIIFVTNWKEFLGCRIALGLGMGAKASVVSIYISETAPESIRGRMAMCWQLFDTVGILVGSIANLIIYRYTEHQTCWKPMTYVSSIPALMFLSLIPFCVESPRWLLKRNRYQDALAAQITLHQLPSPIIACGELFKIYLQLEEEGAQFKKTLIQKENSRLSNTVEIFDMENTMQTENSRATGQGGNGVHDGEGEVRDIQVMTLWEKIMLFKHVDYIKRAFRASQIVMIAQQACGINILAFMSTIMFAKAIASDGNLAHLPADEAQRALRFSIYFAIINHFSTLLPLFYIDGAGRRTSLKWSFPGMAITLIIAGGALFLDQDSEHRSRLFIGFTLIFTFFYSIGEGPAAFVISSEVFPFMVRELGMSLAVFTNFLLASILSLCIPLGITKGASHGWFWTAFGGSNILMWILSLLFVNETSGDTLEEINKKYNKSWKEGNDFSKWVYEKTVSLSKAIKKGL